MCNYYIYTHTVWVNIPLNLNMLLCNIDWKPLWSSQWHQQSSLSFWLRSPDHVFGLGAWMVPPRERETCQVWSERLSEVWSVGAEIRIAEIQSCSCLRPRMAGTEGSCSTTCWERFPYWEPGPTLVHCRNWTMTIMTGCTHLIGCKEIPMKP